VSQTSRSRCLASNTLRLIEHDTAAVEFCNCAVDNFEAKDLCMTQNQRAVHSAETGVEF
jgi:hypothetical protein